MSFVRNFIFLVILSGSIVACTGGSGSGGSASGSGQAGSDISVSTILMY